MEEKDWMNLLSSQNQIQKILEVNQKTARYGLELTEADAKTNVFISRARFILSDEAMETDPYIKSFSLFSKINIFSSE